ncbi:MAG: hypothetical protein LBJ01_00950 [Tannerella sp.]|nr:hypothetical protein [Tannerella sp.]
MKKIIGLWMVFLLAGCSGATKKHASGCENSALYGYVNFCLPEMDGMTECRTQQGVQEVIQPYLASGPVLAYYLNSETYGQVDRLKDIPYEDYFLMYGEYRLENYYARETDLEQAQKDLEQTLFEEDSFDRISDRIEEYYRTMTVGKPALIEKYSPRPNVRTMIVLIKYMHEDGETSVVSAIDFILMKNRLFNLAYYVAYTGGKSIDGAKSKNNAFIDRLLDLN